MIINNLEELEQLLLNDKITPNQANKVLNKSLGLLDVSFSKETTTKEQVLEYIRVIQLNNNETPLFSLKQIKKGNINEYNIKDTFK